MKAWRWALAAIAAILLLAVALALWVARSDWLRERIRAEIVAQVEKATGGKAELGSFAYDWPSTTVRLDRFLIRGREAAGQAPLLAVDRIVLHLRIISLLHGDIRIAGIEADHPQTHLIVYPDGRTNIPGSKIDNGSVRQKILDLKIAKFDIRNGMFLLETAEQPSRAIPWNAQGDNLSADIVYEAGPARYSGGISISDLHLASFDLRVDASAAFEKNRIVVSHALLKTAHSQVELRDAVVTGFRAPVTTSGYDARISLTEAAALFKTPYKPAGEIRAAGALRFASLSDYSLSGTMRGTAIDVDNKFRNFALSARYDIRPAKASFTAVRLNVLGGEASGDVETADFKSFRASGNLAHFDLREIAKLQTRQSLPYDGLISGSFNAAGRIGHADFDSRLSLVPAGSGPPVRGEIAVRYDAAAAKVHLGDSWLELPHTRVNVSGTLGDRLDVKLDSADIQDLRPALDIATGGKPPAVNFASLAFAGTVSGALANPAFSGRVGVKNAAYSGHVVDSFSGDIAVSRANATASHADLVYGGIHATGAGSIELANWMPSLDSRITATVELNGASLAAILNAAGHKEVDVTGTLNTTARITGTVGAPLADADVALTRGFIYKQPFDSVSGRLQVVNRNEQALTGVFVSGPKRVSITARFDHAGTQFPAGTLEFNLTSNTMPLNQIALVRERQPDIHGFGKFHADGALIVGHDAKHEIQFNLSRLNADASANGVELGGRDLGDAHFTAQTKDEIMTAHFDSNAAKASIEGVGTVRLTGDYPAAGTVTFKNAGLNALAALIVKADDARDLDFDGSAEGSVTFSGPLRTPDRMTASFDVPHLEVHPLAGSPLDRELPKFSLTNVAPVRATLSNSSLTIENARFKAPETDVTVAGAAAFTGKAPLNLRVQGNINLALVRTFNADLTSTGSIAIDAAIRGDWLTPDFSGRATIRNGSFHYADFANGLTAANGEIVFSGTHATIQSFSAESGGGKVDVSGFAALAGGLLSFRLEAQAHAVRVRYPEGISSVSDAALTFAGTSERSQTSGTITVHRVSINPRSDAANILASAAEPIQTPAARTGLAANMNLDVQIATAPDVSLQTSVTQSLQADANLRLRGTVTNPALIGRINITQGEMVFFGNKYSINTGSISFFNPAKIEPILNIDLETRARGVDVILTVSGPITRLNVTYRSDPPLQFSDIVALIATGRAPTDSTLAQNTGQSQNFQQLGASALIGQAIANPVAGRLQRFFGVSRLKIDPSLTGITGSPEARLTIEQQVTPEILFTYITDVSSTSTQLIRVEWSFNRRWSAILIREENGYVGLDFAYKKRFK